MFISLTTQYLFQAPDCHLFTIKAGCISGCASGIPPVLKLGHRDLVNNAIIRHILPSNYMQTSTCGSSLCLSTTKNIGRNISDVLSRPRLMVAVPLEEF